MGVQDTIEPIGLDLRDALCAVLDGAHRHLDVSRDLDGDYRILAACDLIEANLHRLAVVA